METIHELSEPTDLMSWKPLESQEFSGSTHSLDRDSLSSFTTTSSVATPGVFPTGETPSFEPPASPSLDEELHDNNHLHSKVLVPFRPESPQNTGRECKVVPGHTSHTFTLEKPNVVGGAMPVGLEGESDDKSDKKPLLAEETALALQS